MSKSNTAATNVAATKTAAKAAASLAVLLITVTALTACAPESSGSGAIDSQSQAQAAAFPEVYDQTIDWVNCAEVGAPEDLEDILIEAGVPVQGMKCASITVPFDWEDPNNAETIQLIANRIPASGTPTEAEPHLGSLLINPGGPGASGVELAFSIPANPEIAPVLERYDLIGFDPRGMARSSGIECQSTEVTEITELQLALCAQENPLAKSIGTTQVARDMELMRHLLGEEHLNYLGISYGTVIGASYATLFPDRVGRLTLDSAWPSDWSSPLGRFEQQEAISFALEELLNDCGIDYEVANCPASTTDALMASLEPLEQSPLQATDGTLVDRGMAMGLLNSALYTGQVGREKALNQLGLALAGDQDTIDEIAVAMADGGSAVSLSGLIVRCLSSPQNAGLAELYEYINDHGLPLRMGGPEINDKTLKPWLDLFCDAVPNKAADHLNFNYPGKNPILVIGITGDHATPYPGSGQLVSELGNARLLTLDARGHAASYSGKSKCVDDATTAFFLTGELPAEGTICTEN